VDSRSAEGAEVERHRIEAPREEGCGEVPEEGAVPLLELASIT